MGGVLVRDQPVVIHCYTTPADIADAIVSADLGVSAGDLGARPGKAKLGS